MPVLRCGAVRNPSPTCRWTVLPWRAVLCAPLYLFLAGGLCKQCEDIEEFPPGTYYTPETGYVNYYQPAFLQEGYEHDPNSECPVVIGRQVLGQRSCPSPFSLPVPTQTGHQQLHSEYTNTHRVSFFTTCRVRCNRCDAPHTLALGRRPVLLLVASGYKAPDFVRVRVHKQSQSQSDPNGECPVVIGRQVLGQRSCS